MVTVSTVLDARFKKNVPFLYNSVAWFRCKQRLRTRQACDLDKQENWNALTVKSLQRLVVSSSTHRRLLPSQC